MLRTLLLKLVNEIDTTKLDAIFEEVVRHLAISDDAARLTLLFKIFNQSVALKFGRRINQGSVVILT